MTGRAQLHAACTLMRAAAVNLGKGEIALASALLMQAGLALHRACDHRDVRAGIHFRSALRVYSIFERLDQACQYAFDVRRRPEIRH